MSGDVKELACGWLVQSLSEGNVFYLFRDQLPTIRIDSVINANSRRALRSGVRLPDKAREEIKQYLT